MNENYMGPAQAMEGQLQNILRDATASVNDQRANRAAKAQDLQDMAKLIDWHLSTAKDLFATDKVASYEMFQGGMRLMNREVPSFEQYDSASALINGAADDYKNKDLGAMKFKLSQGDKLGIFRNTQDIARVSELQSQLQGAQAEQQAKAIADVQQPEHPQLARAREHISMIDMVGGDLSRVQPDELIRLTGRTDRAGQEEQLVHDRAIVGGQDAKQALQKRMQSVFALNPAAFGRAAEITAHSLTDPETMAKIFISDMIAKGDARTDEETQRMTAKIETYMPNSPLAAALGIKSSQRDSELTRQQLEDLRGRQAELDEHVAVDGKAMNSVTSLGAAVQGLGLSTGNLQQATTDMKLTPQETALYQRHLNNLGGTGKVRNEDGSISTLYQMSFEEDGKTYNIPTVWEGKILEPDDAIKRARQEGLDQFPSYGSEKEAEARYQKMHGYMEKDTGSYIGQHPVDDKTAKQLVLAEGTRVVQGETYKIQADPRIKDLEQKAQAADAQLNQLKAQTVTALPGQKDALMRKQKDLEAESTANRALVRLLRDESPYAIAERKSELILNYTPQGRMDLEKLEQQREKDLKVVETEQTRLRRRETTLSERQTDAEKKAEEERKFNGAQKAADALIQKGGLVAPSVRTAAEQFGVNPNELGKRVQGARSTGLWEAQIAFGMLPTAQQTTQKASQLAKQYGVSPVDVKKVMEDPNKPLVQVDMAAKASTEAAKDFIKSTRTTYDQLKSAPILLRNIDEAKALIPQAKGFMGPGGESLLEAAKFLNNRLGAKINVTGIKSAEELRTRIFFNIMENLKKMDAQPSQMQQQIMMDSLGKLGTDPNALSGVLDAYADTIRDKVELFNQEVGGAMKQGTQFPYDPRISLPGRKGPAGEAVIRSDAEYEALPPGTMFIGPDGKKRRKP